MHPPPISGTQMTKSGLVSLKDAFDAVFVYERYAMCPSYILHTVEFYNDITYNVKRTRIQCH